MRPTVTPAPIFDDTVSLLETLVADSSPTGDAEGLDRVTARYGRALERRGLETDFTHQARAASGEPMLIAHPGGQRPERPLMLIGHLDTVLPARPTRRRGERLFGSGTSDMKGGMATLVGALDVLAERGTPPPEDLLVVVVPDEEILGPVTRYAVETIGATARMLWSLEPGKRMGINETVVIGRRGLFDWRLDATGRAAHAGSSYWHGRSALGAAAAWSLAAMGLSMPDDGPSVSAARLVAGEAAFVADPGADRALLGSSRQLNIVPNRACVEGEARHLLAEEGPALMRALEALATDIGRQRDVTLRFEVTKAVAPMEPRDANRQLAERAGQLAKPLGFTIGIEDQRGGLSFPNLLPPGSETLALDGLGPAGGGMHTEDEWVDLVSLDRRITLLADLLADHQPTEADGRCQGA